MVGIVLGAGLGVVATAPAGAAPSAPDQAILQAGVVQPVDLPTGWSQLPPRGSGGRARFLGIAACRAIQKVNDAGHKAPHRQSGTWYDPANAAQTTIASDVVVAFKDAAGADAFLAAYQAPKAVQCLEKDARSKLPKRVKELHPTITFAPIADATSFGGGSAGYELTISVTTQGQTQVVVNDNVVMKVGRAALVLTTQDTPLRNQLLGTLASRLAAAGA